METRIAVTSIIVEDPEAVGELNAIIHDYRQYVIGRMGIPYQKCDISVISIVMDAPNDIISAFSGKLGMLPNVTTKTAYSRFLKPADGNRIDLTEPTSKTTHDTTIHKG
jgi:putative iron-only hydrogenase system regulator